MELRSDNEFKFKASINTNFEYEEKNVILLDTCGDILGRPYLYMRNVILRGRAIQYNLDKDGKELAKDAHKCKSKFPLISAHQARILINANKKFVFWSFKRINNKDIAWWRQ